MPRGEDPTGVNGALTLKVEYFNKFFPYRGSRPTLGASESFVKFKSSLVTCLQEEMLYSRHQVAGGDNNKFSQQ